MGRDLSWERDFHDTTKEVSLPHWDPNRQVEEHCAKEDAKRNTGDLNVTFKTQYSN